MVLAYAPGAGGEDPLVAPRDWSACTGSLGEENLSPEEAEFYDRLNKTSLKYISTSVSCVTHYDPDGSVWHSADGVKYGDLRLSSEEVGVLYMWFRFNHPQYYFLSCAYRFNGWTLCPYLYENMVDRKERAKITNELFDKLEGWIREVEDNAATTYQKELYANNLICEAVTYDRESLRLYEQGIDRTGMELCQSLYSVVILENTVCAGYSVAFTAIMSAMGVDATAGLSNDHAWNVVRCDNGQYYCVDVCWNDKNKPDLAYRNDYFNIGDTTLQSKDADGYHIYLDYMAA